MRAVASAGQRLGPTRFRGEGNARQATRQGITQEADTSPGSASREVWSWRPKRESSGSRFGLSWLGGGQRKEASSVATPTSGSSAGESGDVLGDEENVYMDTALDEAAVVVFYAWHRFPHELRELTMLRTMLGERYGKEFMTLAQDNKVDSVKVPDRLLKGLRVRPPGQELVESYLREIAKAYGVAWPEGEDVDVQEELGNAPPEFVDDSQCHGGDEHQGDMLATPTKQQPDAAPPSLSDSRRASETSELNKATPPRGPAAGRSPVSVAPPAPRTDNPNPHVKIPGAEERNAGASAPGQGAGAAPSKGNKNGIPELDELTRRFADLKRKP